MSQVDKQIQEASSIIKKIKTKNDIISRMSVDQNKLQSQIHKDKEFLESEIRRFNKILRKIQSSYLDPISSDKVNTLKGEARIQIKRNQYLIKKLVNTQQSASENSGIEMVSHQQVKMYDDSEYKMKLAHQQQKTQMIQKFSASIVQIGQIINQTNDLTIKQGQHLDLVQQDIIATHQNVVATNQNMIQAQKYQKKSRVWIYALTGAIVIAVIIVIVVVLTTK